MEINVDDKNRLVSVWLSKAEKEDQSIKSQLQPLYDNYHSQKYKVGVFLSGGESLFELSKDLLLHNRYKEAKMRENVR